ncbi:MAG: glycosyltransferase family 39 protein [Candidatus Binataceae bacterium]
MKLPWRDRLGWAKLRGEVQARTGIAAVLIAAAIVYCRSLANGFVYDQAVTLAHKKLVGQWSFIWKSLIHDEWWFNDPRHLPQSSYYRPLPSVWIALNYHLFGMHAAAWHAAMVLLHLLVVWLLYRVATLLTQDETAAVVAAAIFALAPLNAESVIFAFSPPIVSAFELGAFEFYLLRAALPEEAPRRPRWRAISLGLYAGALLTHESAVVFPALIALHVFLLGPHRTYRSYRPYGAAFGESWPYALEVFAYLGLRRLVLGFTIYPKNLKSAMAPVSALRIPGALMNYLTLIAMPWRAGPAHSLPLVYSIASPGFYVPLLELIAICAIAAAALWRNPRRRLYLFCAGWFLIALAPMLNVLADPRARSIIHDRYVYLPSAGLYLMAADLAVAFGRQGEWKRRAAAIGAAAILIGEACILFYTQHFWHDDLTLFRACVADSPHAEIWHNRLGIALYAKGAFTAARSEFVIAHDLNPRDGWNQYNLGRIDENLVRINGSIADARKAESEIAAGIRLLPRPPKDAYAQLAMAAAVAGDRKMAEAALAQADKIPGGADIAAMARAQVNFWYRDYAGVERAMRQYMKRKPDDPEALVILGRALTMEHRNAEAIAVLQHAASVAPRDSSLHYVVAFGLHQLGRDAEARKECEIALKIAPNDPRVRQLMAELGGASAAK